MGDFQTHFVVTTTQLKAHDRPVLQQLKAIEVVRAATVAAARRQVERLQME